MIFEINHLNSDNSNFSSEQNENIEVALIFIII